MAKHMKKSGLVASIGAAGKRAVRSHREDKTDYGKGGNLPPGIEGGIAELVECKFDTFKKGDNKGHYFFYAAGIVKVPLVFEGIPVEGLRTSIMEPVCETPLRRRATIEDHVDWVLNEMRKLGVDTSETELEDLETIAKNLRKERPHFRFRTWKGAPSDEFPDPRTQEVWGGVCEPIDDTGEDVVEKGEAEEVAEEDDTSTSLMTLGDLADGGDVASQESLRNQSEKVGLNPNDEAYTTWLEVAAAIEDALEGEEEEEEGEKEEEKEGEEGEKEEEEEGEEEGEEEEEIEPPKKGDAFLFKPPKARKQVECVVLTVSVRNKTCSLQNLENERRYRNVSWEKLEEVS